jgi:hypothetical protein
MATAKQKAHRAKFARAARAKGNTAVGRKANQLSGNGRNARTIVARL